MQHTTRHMTLVLALLCGALFPTWAQTASGVVKTTITIGQSTALTGASSALALPFHQGAKLYFDRVNVAGGIYGRSISLLTLDDGGNPAATRINAQKLAQAGVLALFGSYGSAQTAAAYEAIKDSDGILFAPMAAADELQGANFPNLYSVRPSYSEEALAIVRHAETLGTRKLVIAHGKVAEFLSALDAAERTIQALSTNLLGKIGFEALDRLQNLRPETLLVAGNPQEAGKEPTPAKLRKDIESITNWDMGGFRMSFNGGRTGSRLVELSLIDSTGKVHE